MSVPKTHRWLFAASMSALVGFWALLRWTGAGETHSQPKTVADVVAEAGRLGLLAQSDRAEPGRMELNGRILLSVEPLSLERVVTGLSIGMSWEKWKGVVAVYHKSSVDKMDDDSATMLRPWGDFFIYGDRGLMDKIAPR